MFPLGTQLSSFETAIATPARHERLAACMEQDGRPTAVELFENLSRDHTIRALEERRRLGATLHAQHDVPHDAYGSA